MSSPTAPFTTVMRCEWVTDSGIPLHRPPMVFMETAVHVVSSHHRSLGKYVVNGNFIRTNYIGWTRSQSGWEQTVYTHTIHYLSITHDQWCRALTQWSCCVRPSLQSALESPLQPPIGQLSSNQKAHSQSKSHLVKVRAVKSETQFLRQILFSNFLTDRPRL